MQNILKVNTNNLFLDCLILNKEQKKHTDYAEVGVIKVWYEAGLWSRSWSPEPCIFTGAGAGALREIQMEPEQELEPVV